jgi:hypothetical protein
MTLSGILGDAVEYDGDYHIDRLERGGTQDENQQIVKLPQERPPARLSGRPGQAVRAITVERLPASAEVRPEPGSTSGPAVSTVNMARQAGVVAAVNSAMAIRTHGIKVAARDQHPAYVTGVEPDAASYADELIDLSKIWGPSRRRR